MSAPRAGRSGGLGRGRGGRSRSSSPQVGTQQGQRSVGPSLWTGQHHASADHTRGGGEGAGGGAVANNRGGPTGRGRGNIGRGGTGAQPGLKSSLKTQSGLTRGGKNKDSSRHVTFAFTGDREWRSPENATRKDYKSKISSLWDSVSAFDISLSILRAHGSKLTMSNRTDEKGENYRTPDSYQGGKDVRSREEDQAVGSDQTSRRVRGDVL